MREFHFKNGQPALPTARQPINPPKRQFIKWPKLLGLLTLCLLWISTAYAAPPDVSIKSLEITKQPTPNPAKTGETITAKVKVHLKNSANKEIEPPTGTVFDWEVTAVRKDGTAIATTGVSVTDERETTMTASFADPAEEYQIDLKVTVSNPAWKNDDNSAYTLTDSVTLKVKVQDIVVRFNPSPVKTGFTLPLAASTIEKTVTATVLPATEVGNIAFAVTGEARATITTDAPNATAGTVVLHVKGKSATPKTKPEGDTTIEAKKGAVKKGEVKVIVIIPAAIATPHPTANGAVAGKNMALSAGTSPAWFGALGVGKVKLVTVHAQWLTITVNDQFGNTLDAMYQGAPVSEHGGQAINQNMTAAGTYQDPVFSYRIKGGVSEVNAGGAAETAWLAAAALPIWELVDVQNIAVEVGGHSLSPAIVNRKLTTTAPNNVKVEWP